MKNYFPLVLLALAGCASSGIDRADVDTPINISYAVVTAAEKVKLQSDVGKSAATGGVLGLLIGAVSGGNLKGAAIGAAAGAAASGAITKIDEGSSEAMSYTLQRPDKSEFKVVTDNDHLLVGDCAAVEIGRTTNLRRAEPDMCQPHAVDQKQVARSQASAVDCDNAKQQLLKAETTEELNAATDKVKLLCNN
jgi:outer membrane lipoprotein SlyB